jgi:FkbM family methyltransferase
MPTLRRRIAKLIERVSGNLVIPPAELYQSPERLHLTRLFRYLGVDCVFDVGANVGQYATMLRDRIGYRGDIVSYEPNPEVAASLRKNASNDPKWHVETLALDCEAGPGAFNIMAGSEYSSLLKPAADQPSLFGEDNRVIKEIEVTRATLAGELTRWQAKLGFRHPFLKLDTQGNDAAVIEGAKESLTAFVGVQSELAIRGLYEGAPGYSQALSLLRSRGFVLSALVPNNAGHFPVLVEIDCIVVREDLLPANLR